jgi:serine acetyltransferase
MSVVTNQKQGSVTSVGAPLDQIRFMLYELRLMVKKNKWRWVTCWFGGSAGVIVSYRVDRLGFLVFHNLWPGLRVLFYPFFLILRLLSANHQIHYAANIGEGLKVLHPPLGIVVTGKIIAGRHLTLTGGNCLGERVPMAYGDLVLGDHVTLGANAVVLGPLTLGSRINIGAGAVVIDSAPDDVTLVGVPARSVRSIS